MTALTNWAGNVEFGAAAFHQPESLEQLQQLVAGSAHVRALGSGHSFNRIADTTGDLLSVAALPEILELDPATGSVRVSGGTTYGGLGRYLQANGFALANTGSLPHISVAGACATGTHGSGHGNRNLSSIVRGLELIGPDGELRTVPRADPEFSGSVLALGALGIVTALTLDVVPTFDVRQDVFDDLTDAQFDAHYDEIMGGAYSVSVFSDWRGRNNALRKSRVDEGLGGEADWFGAPAATVPRHPVPGMSTENSTQQLGVPGPWNERLPHFRLEFTPSSGDEIQSEYLLPLEHAVAARQALAGLAERIAAVLLVAEYRTVAGDDLLISPSRDRATAAFHYTWIPDEDAVRPVLAAIEERLHDFDARPHWGKVFVADRAELLRVHPGLTEFAALVHRHDPAGKFGNDLVDSWLPPAD